MDVPPGRPPQQTKPLQTYWFCAVAVTVAAVTVVLAVLIAVIFFRQRSSSAEKLPYIVCNSTLCQDYARAVVASVNPEKNPCKNFYTFVCDGWPRAYNGTTSIVMRANVINATLAAAMISNTVGNVLPQSVISAGALLRSCVDAQKQGRNHVEKLKEAMTETGLSWPEEQVADIDLFDVLLYWTLVWELGAWFTVSVVHNSNNRNVTLYINHNDSRIFYWEKVRLRLMREGRYGNIVSAYLTEFGLANNVSLLNSKIEAITSIESKVVHVLKRTSWAKDWDEHRVSQRWQTAVLKRLTKVLNTTPRLTLEAEPDTLINVEQIIADRDHQREYAYAVGWTVATALGPYVSAQLGTLAFGRNATERMQQCFMLVESITGPNLARLYSSVAVSDEVLLDLHRFFITIQDAISTLIDRSTWLDSSTKSKALSRLRRIAFVVTVPKDKMLATLYGNFSIKEGVPFISGLRTAAEATRKAAFGPDFWVHRNKPLDVNAYFFPSSIKVTVLPGLLQMPMYAQFLPKTMLYAGLGHVFAHEMMHAFDPKSYTKDEFNYNENWWKPDAHRQYEEKVGCIRTFHQQYKRIFGRQLNPQFDAERFADFAGLPGLLDAFHQYAPDVRLPGLVHLGQRIQFFISYCYAMCSSILPSADDPHAPSDERCNVPLMHLEEFSRTFECAAGDPMSPKQKCPFW